MEAFTDHLDGGFGRELFLIDIFEALLLNSSSNERMWVL